MYLVILQENEEVAKDAVKAALEFRTEILVIDEVTDRASRSKAGGRDLRLQDIRSTLPEEITREKEI